MYERAFPMVPTRGSIACRAILDRQTIHVRDMATEPGVSGGRSQLLGSGRKYRIAAVAGRGRIGAVVSSSRRGRRLHRQPGLASLQTFAEQAVIAMTSVRDFRALRERTAELTRSVAELRALEEVLRAVNSSLDLDTVLTTIISRAFSYRRPMRARSTNSTKRRRCSSRAPASA